MMKDLRNKVMGLMDDQSLEAVKLTHYVSILRLMDAPRDRVLEKLLSSHLNRSLNLIQEYAPPSETPRSFSFKSPTTISEQFMQSVSAARRFEQTMMAGLLEACKGIFELYDLYQDNIHMTGGTSPSPLVLTSTPITIPERINALNKLYEMLQTITPQLMELIVKSLKHFFIRYNTHVHQCYRLNEEVNKFARVRNHQSKQGKTSRQQKRRSNDSQQANPFGENEETVGETFSRNSNTEEDDDDDDHEEEIDSSAQISDSLEGL